MVVREDIDMTTIYFVRHAETDNSVRDGRIRPLTQKGLADRRLVTEYLQDKNIGAVLSSPYKRTVDTLADFAGKNGFEIEIIEDFREQHEEGWGDDEEFFVYNEKQWADFMLKSHTGESLAEVQNRNIVALNNILVRHKNKSIAIGTHGIALSTIINYYDRAYGFDGFMSMVNIKPWVVKMDFSDDGCIGMEKINLFNSNKRIMRSL